MSEWTVAEEFSWEGGRVHLVSPSGVVVATGLNKAWLSDIARILNGYEPVGSGQPQLEVTNPAFVKEATQGS